MVYFISSENERSLVLNSLINGIELGANLDVDQISYYSHEKKEKLKARIKEKISSAQLPATIEINNEITNGL